MGHYFLDSRYLAEMVAHTLEQVEYFKYQAGALFDHVCTDKIGHACIAKYFIFLQCFRIKQSKTKSRVQLERNILLHFKRM